MVLESAEIEVYYLCVLCEDTLWAVAKVGLIHPEFNEYGKLNLFLSQEQCSDLDSEISDPNDERWLLKDIQFSLPGINPESINEVITNWYLKKPSDEEEAYIESTLGRKTKMDRSKAIRLGPCKVINIEDFWANVDNEYIEGILITLEELNSQVESTKSKSFINKNLL